MRIGVALIVITDLFIRAGDLSAHYSDEGIWQGKYINTFNGKPGSWSFHALNGSPQWAFLLFALHFLFAVQLLIGYRTQLANFLVWVFTISLHNRNLFVLQGGDDLLRLLLFWGLFLPWNHRYSLDSKAGRLITGRRSWGSAAYLILISSVYFFNVNLKTSGEWHSEGSAIYYALSLDQLRLKPFGDLLYHYPGLMKVATHTVYFIEFIMPVLIMWPARKGYLRFTAFLLLILLHTGIGLTLYIGLFFVINMVSAIGLIPGRVMDMAERKIRLLRSARKPLITQARVRHRVINWLSALFVFVCLVVNLSGLSWFAYELKKEMLYPVNALRLDQYWGMFSPHVLKDDGWYVYYGVDSLGRQWDLRRNEPYVDFGKPNYVAGMYRSDRWRKLAENMQTDSYTFLRPMFCRYIIRKWNQEHPERRMKMMSFYFMRKTNLENYRTTEVKKELFCVCDDH